MHLNGFLAQGEGDLNTNLLKIQMPKGLSGGGGEGGISKPRFDRYTSLQWYHPIIILWRYLKS